MFLYRFFQKFFLFRENKTGVRLINEFTSCFGFSVIEKKHGEIKGEARIVQFFGWELLHDRNSIRGVTVRI